MSTTEKDKYDFIHEKVAGYGNSVARCKWLSGNERLAVSINNIISKASSVLDVGMGKGATIDLLKKKHPDVRFYGVDISEVAVKSRPDLECRVGDVCNLPFKENNFDVLLHLDGMEHIHEESRDKALSEIIRVTRKYAIFEISHRESCEDKYMLENKLEPLHVNIQSCIYWYKVFTKLEESNIGRIYEAYTGRGISNYIFQKGYFK